MNDYLAEAMSILHWDCHTYLSNNANEPYLSDWLQGRAAFFLTLFATNTVKQRASAGKRMDPLISSGPAAKKKNAAPDREGIL